MSLAEFVRLSRGRIEAERLRANAKEIGIYDAALERAIEAWAYAIDTDTADAYSVAADALEEAGAPNSAMGARWLAHERTAPQVSDERSGHPISDTVNGRSR